MAKILYDHGKKVGEISQWAVENKDPVYKTFLGKTVLSIPANDECSFTSPKPVDRKKSDLRILEDGKLEYVLKVLTVKGATFVTAKILGKSKI